MDKSLYLFENDHGYVTSEGRLIQKDNSHFKGKELANCSEENVSEIVAYYEKSFADLQKYVASNLKVLDGESEEAIADRKNLLLQEIQETQALGDFDELIAQIQPKTEQPQAETEEETSEAPSEEKEESQSEETEDSQESESDEQKTGEKTEEVEEAEKPEAKDSESTTVLPALPENASEALVNYHELTQKAVDVSNEKDFQVISHELSNIKLKWDEAGNIDSENATETALYKELVALLQKTEQEVYERKAEFQAKRQERRQNNLEKRERLLDKMRMLVKEEKWQSFGEVKSIERKWENIKAVPAEEGKKQQAELDQLLKTFEDHKVEILVERRQKEEDNLSGKLSILDKMKALNEKITPDTDAWEVFDKELREFAKQWRKIGRVPKEQSDQIWDKFRVLQDEYDAKKFEFNAAYRKELLKNVDKRKKIIKEAKELESEEDLALAARKINQLHRRWKKIGDVPKEENDKLWDEFKEASDKFNEVKAENIDVIKEQEQENLDKKNELIKRAEEIRDSEDWQNGAKQMQALMDEWKTVGPPPRRKASKLWKRFKEAMDVYYNARRDHFKEIKSEQKDNYRKKKEIIAKINELANVDDAQAAIKEVKELQNQFNQIGFVPIKQKDKIYKEYKEACDVVYQRARAESGNLPGTRHMEFADGVSTEEKKDARLKQVEINKLKKEVEKINEEVLQHSDMKTFIKPNKGGLKLISELDEKITKANEKREKLEKKISDLKRYIDKVQE